MTTSDLIKQLEIVKKVKPDQRWAGKNRVALMRVIKKDARQPTGWKRVVLSFKKNVGFFFDMLLPRHLIDTVGRPAMISLSGILILLSGASAVSRSQEALPSTLLYPLKVVSEKVQMSLTGDIEKKVELEMKFAGRRVEELNKLAAANQLTPEQLGEQLNQTTIKLKENINTVNKHLAALNTEGEAKIALSVAKGLDEKANQYSVVLNSIANAVVVKEEVAKAMTQVATVSDNALEVMVAKHKQVTDGISNLEIAEKLNSKIASATNEIKIKDTDTSEQDKKQEEATQIFADATDLVNQGDFKAALSKITEGNDVIKQIREKMENESKVKSQKPKVDDEIIDEEEPVGTQNLVSGEEEPESVEEEVIVEKTEEEITEEIVN